MVQTYVFLNESPPICLCLNCPRFSSGNELYSVFQMTKPVLHENCIDFNDLYTRETIEKQFFAEKVFRC